MPPTTFEQLPDLLTTDEARVYLRVSRNGLYALMRRNEIGHVRVGRQIRIRVEAGGEFVRSEAGDDPLALVDVAMGWKAQFQAKGWT